MDAPINTGDDFPNINSDRYQLVSSIYGPGFVFGWYLLVASVIVNQIFKEDGRFRLNTESAAALLYPIFAASHLMLLAFQFPQSKYEYLNSNLLNYVVPTITGSVIVETDGDGAMVADVGSEDLIAVYPKVIALNAALRITDHLPYICVFGLILVYMGNTLSDRPWPWKQAGPVVLIFGLAWSLIAETILSAMLWRQIGVLVFYISFMYRLCMPMGLFMLIFLWGLAMQPFVFLFYGYRYLAAYLKDGTAITVYIRRWMDGFSYDLTEPFDWVRLVGNILRLSWKIFTVAASIGIWAFLTWCIYTAILDPETQNKMLFPKNLFILDTGISILQYEQIIALFIGIIPFGITMHNAIQNAGGWGALGSKWREIRSKRASEKKKG